MKIIIVRVGKALLALIYAILKLLPVKSNKVLFLSRQSDQLSLDFKMLKERLIEKDQSIQIVSICNRLDDQIKGIVGFGIDTIRSMYHLATCKVCVIDAYWPAVSLLKHKKDLTVIQMWHAIGKIKQSGYQTLGKESGRSLKMAEELRMHKNYDIIIAGGEAWNPYYCLSFGTTEDKLLNIGLPRIDYLIETEKENREKVLKVYPELSNKKVILYAPTFRRNSNLLYEPLVDSIDYSQYILIIKGHPNQPIDCKKEGVLLCPEFNAVSLLSVCDYLITDYSAIAVEAAVLNKKTYYYLFDYSEYASKNGINVSPFDSMPGCAFEDAHELMEDLVSGKYKQDILDNYRSRYLPKDLGTSTEKLANLVITKLRKS